MELCLEARPDILGHSMHTFTPTYSDESGVLQGVSQPARTDNKPVLEHSLHQLLREVHHKTLHLDPPQPATATFGFTKRRRLAGPLGLSRADLKEMADRSVGN
ncbi:hypothetical protein DPMN_087883 [Dreissena polymorpha]|uniref:Uncharacterized protein n=1 Tax=Dreissena polymorpha TaxID=45954 RepID=A0A9D4KT47_DREPO|nr:hypothetical protein DPMN_087883 [Dreissena polymorpha]